MSKFPTSNAPPLPLSLHFHQNHNHLVLIGSLLPSIPHNLTTDVNLTSHPPSAKQIASHPTPAPHLRPSLPRTPPAPAKSTHAPRIKKKMATTSNLQFRVATPDDAVPLQPFVKSAYRGESSRQGWTTEADLLEGDRIDVPGLKAKITAPDAAILLAADDAGALVACCEVAKSSADVAYFGMFAVDPLRQGGGLGRKVLAYAEDYCRRTWGVERMEMSVIWTREELISWYVRRGYKKTGGTAPFPYGVVENGKPLRDDLYFEIMVKDLSGEAVGAVAA